jgi:hypothetical protein
MIVFKQPKNDTQSIDEYIVVGRYDKYAIVKNESDALFILQDEEEILKEGDLCNGKLLISVEQLPETVRTNVYDFIGRK